MRHLWSLLLALVLTPLIYVAAGVSAVRLGEARGLSATAGIGLGAALVAGILYALLVMTRLSPVGPFIGGLALLGVTLWKLLDRTGLEALLPPDFWTEKGALYRPLGMGTALLAAPLLITVFSPRRWRRNANPAAPAFDAAPAYPATVPSAAPAYDESTMTAAPNYTPTTTFDDSYQPASYEPPVYTPPSSATSPTPTYPAPLPASGAQPAGDETQRTGLM